MRIKYNLQSALCLLCFPALLTRAAPGALNPVILIPGDGGSQMDAKLDKPSTVHYICTKKSDTFNLWLNMELLVYGVIDCFIDNIKLTYDNVTRRTSNMPGVETMIPRFGSPETVEWLDPSHASAGSYFNKIGDMLVLNGHTRNVSIRGAPYDFRKAPNENYDYFIQLKTLIEETYANNNNTPVILLAHSMGGPMSLYFLNLQTQSWKDQHIKSLITLSGAWGGSVKAVKVYAIGDDLGSYFLSGSVLKQEQITNPSLAWLLPSSLFWKPDEVLVQTDKKNYSLSNLKDYFFDLDYMDGWDMHKDTKPYTLNFSAPNVEVHCLYGTEVPTVEKLYYKPGTWLDGKPLLINGDGDGTVNRRSLEGCLHWRSLQKQRVFASPLPSVDHMSILSHKDVLDYIQNLIQSYGNST